MREKIVNLMKNEGLSSSRLAELLETQPSAISHLMSGRNKPSYDLLQKILRRFPRVNPDWLLLDAEDMYREEPSLSLDEPSPSADLSPSDPIADLFSTETESAPSATPDLSAIFDTPTTVNSDHSKTSDLAPSNSRQAVVERIVVFYSDHTFVSYNMRK